MRRLLVTGRATAFAHRMERGGRLFRFAHHLHLERDSEGHVTGVAATVEDLEEASVERRASSHFDQLTRLANAAPFRNWVRSEEHTSELQSLMRNSYAVFCLKKKKYN